MSNEATLGASEASLPYMADPTIPYKPGLHPCCKWDADGDGNCPHHRAEFHWPLRCNPSVQGTGTDVQCSCGELIYGQTLANAERNWHHHHREKWRA